MNDTTKPTASEGAAAEATVEATTDEATATEQTETKSCASCSSCSPHTSLLVAVAALLLAGYAVFGPARVTDTSATDQQIAQLESEIAGLRADLGVLGEDVANNRENLVQTKLQRALGSIEDIGAMASQETRATIAEVEKMLRTLTDASGDQEEATPEAAPEVAADAGAAADSAAAPDAAVSDAVDTASEAAADATAAAPTTEPAPAESGTADPAAAGDAQPAEAPAGPQAF